MSRLCLALGVLVAAGGCGVTALAPSIPSDTVLDRRVTGAPDLTTVTSSVAAAGRRNRIAGYYWVGYTPADFGTGDLRDLGSGSGFSYGIGLTFNDAARAFLEIAFEKTVDHTYGPNIAAGGATQPTGHHERALLGGRTTAAAMARLQRQPRPYATYGVSNNLYKVDSIDPTKFYDATGLGFYFGLGVEFPFSQKMSMNFDTRYHTWSATDTNGLDGQFSSLAMSLLWVGRF